MVCQRCNEKIELSGGERIGFRETCDGCGDDLHVCLNCNHHDPAAYNGCKESSAERVADPESSNRCEYFSPILSPLKSPPKSEKMEKANPLDVLFKS